MKVSEFFLQWEYTQDFVSFYLLELVYEERSDLFLAQGFQLAAPDREWGIKRDRKRKWIET